MARAMHLSPATGSKTRNRGAAVSCGYLLYSALLSLFCAAYIECFLSVVRLEQTEAEVGLLFGQITPVVVLRLAALWIAFFVALCLLSSRFRVFSWIERHRYVLAGALLLLLVIFQISGSSIGVWSNWLSEPQNSGTLFGLPREIRSDEWCAFTPFSFSQTATGNQAVSPVIRGGMTDVTMVYAQPSWCVATLYRPFLWGYLVLGASRGLSFFWCSRAIALVLVTYELMLLVTEHNKRAAAYGALLVGFAPMVEWWFAVNGTVELFVFGQGLVLALHHVLRARSNGARWGWSLLLAWQIGCYALIIYPAWQVPLVYVFGFLGIWDMARWLRHTDKDERPRVSQVVVPLVACIAASLAGVAFAVWQAWDAMQLVLHTSYPGDRFFSGGGYLTLFHNPTTSVVSGYWTDLYAGNVCESAAFLSLAPLGAIMSLALLVRGVLKKTVDSCLVFALIPYAILSLYGIVGFPAILAKLSLLSYTPTGRLPIALGYLDVLLLVRSSVIIQGLGKEGDASRDKGRHTLVLCGSLCLFALFVCGVVWLARKNAPLLMGNKATAIVAVAIALMALPHLMPPALFRGSAKRETWLVASAFVPVVVALCINPLHQGARELKNSNTLGAVAQIAASDSQATWLADDSVLGQGCITAGAATINSLNVYPNLDMWKRVDPSGASFDVYNRYAHIRIEPAKQTTFELTAADAFVAHLTPEDIVKLGASYWLSEQDLTAWNTNTVRFDLVAEAGCFKIYAISSSGQAQ